MKKLFMLITLLPLMALAYETWTDPSTGIKWTYTVQGDGTVSIGGDDSSTQAVPTTTTGSLSIPARINGKFVTSVGCGAFKGCSGLMSVVVPNSVTKIGYAAFSGCSGLTSMTLPFVGSMRGNSEKREALFGYVFGTSSYIGATATEQYYSLNVRQMYYIPSSLKSVVITDETTIGYGAFCNCSELTSVTIPSSVTSICARAFSSCSKMSAVLIPDGVPSLEFDVFGGCSSLMSIDIPEGVTSIGQGAFKGCCSLMSVGIPESVTSVGFCAFEDCCSLASVTIPSSVTRIYERAFSGCSSLASVEIPENVTHIGRDVFLGTKLLQDHPDGQVIIDNCLIAYKGICSGTVEIAEGVRLFAAAAFCNCSGLTSVTIPPSVMSIGQMTFSDCIGLTSVTISNGVMCIEGCAFSGCKNLTSVTIPSSVTSIGECAFSGCSGLTSVMIPSSVTSIGERAFSGCSGLTSVTIPAGVTSFGACAFSDCSGLTSVTISNGVTSVGQQAFYNCSGLMSVVIPSSVTNIGNSAFSGCAKLTTLTIPSSVKRIGDSAFYDCSALMSVTIHEGVMCIEGCAFSGCKNLASVTIPSSVTSIGERAFEYCGGLTFVSIPASVVSIGRLAFFGCDAIKDAVVAPGLEGSGMGFSSLTNLVIAEGATSIGEGAFSGCTRLIYVTIPSSVTNIGECAFRYCSGLRSMTVSSSVASVAETAFYGCSSLTIVRISDDGDVDGVKEVLSGSWLDVSQIAFVGGSYKIVFDANPGGILVKTCANGKPFGELPVATRNGYAFVGWYTAAAGGKRKIETDNVSAAATLYAHWVNNSYLVRFNACGGEGEMTDQTFTYDVEQTLAVNAFARRGYAFAGWAGNDATNGMEFVDGEVVSNLTAEADGIVDLYAVWTANGYMVRFDANGGTGTMADQAFVYDVAQKLTTNAFAKTGYTFAGWSVPAPCGEDASGTVLSDGEVVSNLTAEVDGTVTLYAQWTANEYVVDFNPGQGGSGTMPDQPMTYDEEDALYSNLFCRVGYTFLGWTDDPEAIDEVLFCDGVVVSNLTDAAGGDYDLYAIWAANEYTVRFDGNGGKESMEDQTFVYDVAQALTSNAFVWTGYAFAGWARDAATGVSPPLLADAQVVSNLTAEADGVVTLRAVWELMDVVPGEKVEIDPGLVGWTPSGLPSGLKYDKTTGMITGATTKPGEYTVTFKKSGEADETLTIVVTEVPKLSVSLVGSGTGKVSGAGGHLANAKVTLKATADAKDAAAKVKSAFAGWFADADCTRPLDGTLDYRTASFPFVMPAEDVSVYAKFVTVAEDAARLSVANIVAGETFVANGNWTKKVEIDSCSIPSVSAKGLPAGLKFDAKTLTISGKPTKPGKYDIELSLKNTSVKTAKKFSFKIVVPNLESDLIADGVDYASDAYTYVAGTKIVPILPVLAEGVTVKAAGLPSGLKLVGGKNRVPYSIEGTSTAKPGAYTVTLTLAKGKVRETATITVNIENRKLDLVMATCDGSLTNGCKVTGGGLYAAGKKVTLKATAAKDAVFAGWYRDPDCTKPLEGPVDYRTASYSYVTTDQDETIYAKFAPSADDGTIGISVNGNEVVDDSGAVRVVVKDAATLPSVVIGSVSIPKASVKGLPAGLKWDAKKNCFTGAPTKPGVYKVTFSLTNTTVKKAIVRAFTIEVPNFESPAFPGLKPESDAYPVSVGVAALPAVDAGLASAYAGYAVKVTGLPSGLAWKNGVLTGLAKKAGDYTVTFTATQGKDKQVSTITIHVEALPDWAVGTFVGMVRQVDRDERGEIIEDEDGLHDWYDILTTVSVTSAGKVSGKLHFESGTDVSFKSDSISERTDAGYVVRGQLKACGIASDFELLLRKIGIETTGVGDLGLVDVMMRQTARQEGSGWIECDETTFSTDENAPLRQNVWSSKKLLLPPDVKGVKKTVMVEDNIYALTFGKNGSVKVSLAKADKPTKAIASGSATLSIVGYASEVWHTVLCTSVVVKKNDYGAVCIFDVTISVDGTVICVRQN